MDSEPIVSMLTSFNTTPIISSTLAAVLAFAGWQFTLRDFLTREQNPNILNKADNWNEKVSQRGAGPSQRMGTARSRNNSAARRRASEIWRSDLAKQSLNMLLALISVFLIAKMLTRSQEISTALAIIATSFPALIARNRAAKFQLEEERAWPEAIDSVISSLYAGQSINESITSLEKYGPVRLQYIFKQISNRQEMGATLTEAIQEEASFTNSPSANQLFVTLIQAKEFGGQEVTSTLRLLANFLRDQAAAIEEIETRFGWVKNSAMLGAFAPWLLLALLSMQQSTVAAYATDAGRVVLTIGILATAVAFIWMEKMARLPAPHAPLTLKSV